MIDLAEAIVIAAQIKAHLMGKRIATAALASRKEKSYRDAYLLRVRPEAFHEAFEGATLTDAYARYRHVCIETDGGSGLDIWDVYGRILYIEAGKKVPGNPPISLTFDDDSKLVVLPGVFGQMRVRTNEELRALRDSENPDAIEINSGAFTVEALQRHLAREAFQKSIVKAAITKHGTPGLVGAMGANCQEAFYRAGVGLRCKAREITPDETVRPHGAKREICHAPR